MIEAPVASRLNKYVQSATLDGKPFARTWLPSPKLHAGGRLQFDMGAQPNRSWGASANAAPPSLSN